MKTIQQIVQQGNGVAGTVSSTRAQLTLTAGWSSQQVKALKWLFLDIAKRHCPQFMITQHNSGVITDLFNWCALIPGTLSLDKNLWIYGNIGTGKSTMLLIIRDFCKQVRPADSQDNPYSFGIDRADDVCAEYAKSGEVGLNPYLNLKRKAFDEVGSESIPTYHYGSPLNVFQRILQARYDRRYENITHVTSNISPEQIKKVYGERVYDRCREMFNFVKFSGPSFRN